MTKHYRDILPSTTKLQNTTTDHQENDNAIRSRYLEDNVRNSIIRIGKERISNASNDTAKECPLLTGISFNYPDIFSLATAFCSPGTSPVDSRA